MMTPTTPVTQVHKEHVVYVEIPQNISEGDTFNAIIDGEVVSIVCPKGCRVGQYLELSVQETRLENPPRSMQETILIEMIEPSDQMSARNISSRASMLYSWLTLEVVIFILLTLAYSLPPFCRQLLSNDCRVYNARKLDEKITNLNYHIFKGLSTSATQCDSSGSNFCIPWTDGGWRNFDGYARSSTGLFFNSNTESDWYASQIFIPLASACCMVAIIVHVVVLVYNRKLSDDRFYGSSVCACSLMITLTFIFALSGINVVAYSASTSTTVWNNFFNAASQTTEAAIQLQSFFPELYFKPPDPSITTSACQVRIFYSNGGGLLSGAISLSFVTAFFIMVGGLCLLPLSSSESARRRASTASSRHSPSHGHHNRQFDQQSSTHVVVIDNVTPAAK